MKKLAAVMASLFLSHVIAFADTPTVRQGTSRLSDPNKGNDSSLGKPGKTWSHTSLGTTHEEKGARDLIESWCSAYGQSDSERLVPLEMNEVEIVDRFGDWHHLTGLKDRERFWRAGFDMIRSKDFHPKCTIEHVRVIRSDIAVVQTRVSYDHGISLKGGDRIPPFSEIHTFVVMKTDEIWLISVQDIVQERFLR
jgi:ketosteroid isomerase-like protein